MRVVSDTLLPLCSVSFVGLVSLVAVWMLQKLPCLLGRTLPVLTATGVGALLGMTLDTCSPIPFQVLSEPSVTNVNSRDIRQLRPQLL
jgi:hypothetical protein